MQTIYFGTDQPSRGVAIGVTADPAAHLTHLQRHFPGFYFLHLEPQKDAAGGARYLHQSLRTQSIARSGPERWFSLDPTDIESALEHWQQRLARHHEELALVDQRRRLPHKPESLEPTAADRTEIARLRAIRLQIDALRFEQECLETRLKLRIGDAGGLRSLCRWKLHQRNELDRDRLRQECPEIYHRYLRQTGVRYFTLLPVPATHP